jgi:hypothetical protein
MPLKKFTSRLSLLKIEEQAPFWWNEAEVSFAAALHKTQSFTLMNLLQELIPFRKEFWDMLKDCKQKGLRYWSPPLHG